MLISIKNSENNAQNNLNNKSALNIDKIINNNSKVCILRDEVDSN